MSRWRVEVNGPEIAAGVELEFQHEGGAATNGDALRGGDTLEVHFATWSTSQGNVLFADRAEAVIAQGQGKWKIQQRQETGDWVVIGAVE